MAGVLDPTVHPSYFDEIRSLMAPDHILSATQMPNSIIAQYGYLGRAEVIVLRATDETAANLRPPDDGDDDNASLVPETLEAQAKREKVYVIECLTALYLLQPQVLQEALDGMNVRYEEWGIDRQRRELETIISGILPEVLTPSTPATETTDEIIGVVSIGGTF